MPDIHKMSKDELKEFKEYLMTPENPRIGYCNGCDTATEASALRKTFVGNFCLLCAKKLTKELICTTKKCGTCVHIEKYQLFCDR